MDLFKYTLCDIELVMADIDGTLYCSTPQLEKVLQVTRSQLNNVANIWRNGEFNDVRLGSIMSGNHIHKDLAKTLCLQRARKNTRLWSEDDVLGFCFHLRGDIVRQCRVQFKEILKQHTRKDYIPREKYDELLKVHSSFIEQISSLKEAVESNATLIGQLMSDRKQMASNAGRSLRLVKRD